jgi:uncharacterized protein (DUF849 family)
MINPPARLHAMAERIRCLGVKAELEIFDTGHFGFTQGLVQAGLLGDRPLNPFGHGIPWGMPADVGLPKNMVDQLAGETFWTSFAITRMQMPWVARSILLGGHVRVGLEDNLYPERGTFASNAQLVEKAASLILTLGASLAGPQRAREPIGLPSRA